MNGSRKFWPKVIQKKNWKYSMKKNEKIWTQSKRNFWFFFVFRFFFCVSKKFFHSQVTKIIYRLHFSKIDLEFRIWNLEDLKMLRNLDLNKNRQIMKIKVATDKAERSRVMRRVNRNSQKFQFEIRFWVWKTSLSHCMPFKAFSSLYRPFRSF